MLKVTYNEVFIVVKLDDYGFAYGVAVPKNTNLGKPKPFQISRRLNNFNMPHRGNYTEASEKFTPFTLYIQGLEPDTVYNLYVTAGSAHPGYPDLMSDSQTQMLEFTTLKAPASNLISTET